MHTACSDVRLQLEADMKAGVSRLEVVGFHTEHGATPLGVLQYGQVRGTVACGILIVQ